jgi:IS5 family transposase
MVPKEKSQNQRSLFFSFSDTLNQKHPLYILANMVQWEVFEKAFAPLYSADTGRPAKPIRLMVGLLMLKHIRNLSDEMVVEQWSENIYFQYFTGESSFASGFPCKASYQVHFRKRIGESGQADTEGDIRIKGKNAEDPNVNVHTVGEKNITSRRCKLHKKNIQKM